MAQNQIIFTTYCEDHLQERFGTHKLVKTFEYFNPHYKLVVLGTKEIQEIHKKYNVNYGNALPAIMLDVKRKYDSVYICHIDSDSLVLGWLKEIATLNYDIASCRNNCDSHTGDERQNRPVCLWRLPNERYVNCGLTSCNSESFLIEWMKLNEEVVKDGGIKSFSQADIQWFNYLFHYGGYKSKILDPKDGNLFYGPSANMCDSEVTDNPEHIMKAYNYNGWQSWKKIEYNEENENFYLYGKLVRLLHMTGGSNENSIKCSLDMFNDKTRKILQEITGYSEKK